MVEERSVCLDGERDIALRDAMMKSAEKPVKFWVQQRLTAMCYDHQISDANRTCVFVEALGQNRNSLAGHELRLQFPRLVRMLVHVAVRA